MLFTVFSRMKSEKFIVGKIFIFTTQDETEIKLFALKRWGCRIILCDVLEAHELTKSHALLGLLCTRTFCLLFSAVNVLIALLLCHPGACSILHLGKYTFHCKADNLYLCSF